MLSPLILAYVPEISDQEFNLRLEEAAEIARERDEKAATNLLFDISECDPSLSGERQLVLFGGTW